MAETTVSSTVVRILTIAASRCPEEVRETFKRGCEPGFWCVFDLDERAGERRRRIGDIDGSAWEHRMAR